MTRKKKLSKRRRKERRRAAMERKRRERGWEPPPPPPTARQHELLDDMLPLFPGVADPSAPLLSIEPVLRILAGSSALVDEAEFEEIIVDPMLSMVTFVAAAEEMGHDPDDLLKLPEEEREDVHVDILVETIRRLLTEDLRQQIRDGLDRYRLRLKRAGDRQEVAKAAMLLSFLDEDAGDEVWAMVGLVQAIFQRSVYIGFELAESGVEMMDAADAGEEPVAMLERLTQSRVGRKAESLLKRVPGLSKYLSSQADVAWDEGMKAIFTGDLYLELYSKEELAAGLEMFGQMMDDAVAEARADGRGAVVLSQEKAQDFVALVGRYVGDLFTPERLDQLRARLDAALRSRAFGEDWFPFVYMLKQYVDKPDAAENERQFLVNAFLGELRHIGEVLEGRLENEEEE